MFHVLMSLCPVSLLSCVDNYVVFISCVCVSCSECFLCQCCLVLIIMLFLCPVSVFYVFNVFLSCVNVILSC